MKKNYVQPTAIVVKLENKSHLLQVSNTIKEVSTNLGDDDIIFEGGGDGDARARSYTSDWDDWE